MFADIEDFLRELDLLANEIFPNSNIEIVYERVDKASLRITLKPLLFIDVYANTETDRYDFSLINGNKRVFGYDNLGGWHCHPARNPNDHVECKSPVLRQIFEDISLVFSNK